MHEFHIRKTLRGDSINIKRQYWVLLFLMMLLLPVKAYAADLNSSAAEVTVSSGRLNVRSGPSTDSAKVTALNKGTLVTLISKQGPWWKVEYAKGKFGYCHENYLRPRSGTAATVNIRSGSLNVRSGAGTNYGKVNSLYKGEALIVLSSSGGWSKILYHGTKTGYVSSAYLSNYYSAIHIQVPNLKQNDTRWAGLTIADSGKTFAQIGCATTGIAMIESLRRGTVIYPDVMARELKYTPSGSVYWPSDYRTVTDNSLNSVYNQLKHGKAVLYGAKNQYGGQHWVVINGFNGGDSLTTSGFTVLDPGSYSRTTLQQFLNAYPMFYKYLIY